MNDDTLILYYYRDGLAPNERQQIANALATDPALAERYRALTADLALLPDDETAPVPADMLERWHMAVERAANLEAGRTHLPRLHSWSFLLGAAVTAALAIGVGIGLYLAADDADVPAPAVMVGTDPGEPRNSSAFLRALQVHLRDSERNLASLPAATADDRMRLILNLIDQNRLFERAAEQNDAARLARVLRAFELALVELAAGDIPEDDAEAMRERLIFELKVMLTKLSNETSDEPNAI